MLGKMFDISTDFLLKDEVEEFDSITGSTGPDIIQINVEQALKYVENKMEVTGFVTKGILLCVCSVIPLFFFLAMAETNRLGLTSDIAAWIGVVSILVIISIGISFFIRANQYGRGKTPIENEPFELAYGVHSVFKEKLQKFRAS
jgi:hypothetical protein